MGPGQNSGESNVPENQAGANGPANPPVTDSNVPGNPPSPPPPAAPKAPFPEPEVLQALINPNDKPKEGPTPFKFTTPKKVQDDMTQPTKGDVARAAGTVPGAEPPKPKMTLAELDAEIARDEKSGQEHSYDDYRETSEMVVLGWEALLTFVSRRISKDTSDTAYEFSEKQRERLIHMGTKVSRKRNWVMPVEYLFLGTAIPASASIILKADDKRREDLKKNEHLADQGKEPEVNKGGPNKGFEKRRGPGRPRK